MCSCPMHGRDPTASFFTVDPPSPPVPSSPRTPHFVFEPPTDYNLTWSTSLPSAILKYSVEYRKKNLGLSVELEDKGSSVPPPTPGPQAWVLLEDNLPGDSQGTSMDFLPRMTGTIYEVRVNATVAQEDSDGMRTIFTIFKGEVSKCWSLCGIWRKLK